MVVFRQSEFNAAFNFQFDSSHIFFSYKSFIFFLFFLYLFISLSLSSIVSPLRSGRATSETLPNCQLENISTKADFDFSLFFILFSFFIVLGCLIFVLFCALLIMISKNNRKIRFLYKNLKKEILGLLCELSCKKSGLSLILEKTKFFNHKMYIYTLCISV
jgi:hypothetical protein